MNLTTLKSLIKNAINITHLNFFAPSLEINYSSIKFEVCLLHKYNDLWLSTHMDLKINHKKTEIKLHYGVSLTPKVSKSDLGSKFRCR